MKLVDILARELKVWPADCDSVTQSKLHAEIHNTPNGRISESRKFLPGIFLNERHEEGGYPLVTRAEWQAAVDALNAPKIVEWDGVGLPPVGAVCEHFGTAEHTNWIEVQVIGSGNVRHHDVAFFEYMAGTSGYTVSYSTANNFRPIRTAERVDAEERDKGIQEICDTLGWLNIRSDGSAQEAAILYDAGYRKEQKPCGS